MLRKQMKEKSDLCLCEHREPVVHTEDCSVLASTS